MEIEERLTKIEAHIEALELFVLQTAAWLPDPQTLMEHLPVDLENHLLYTKASEAHVQHGIQVSRRMLAMLLHIRRDIAAAQTQRIAVLLGEPPSPS